MCCSNDLESTEVIEIGLKSLGCDGSLTFGTGVMILYGVSFHAYAEDTHLYLHLCRNRVIRRQT